MPRRSSIVKRMPGRQTSMLAPTSTVNLHNTVALITGAKRIGAVVAEALAGRGIGVALSYSRSKAEADLVAERARALGVKSASFHADLTSPDECRALIAQTVSAFGRLDILIHMASVYTARPFAELTDADWAAAANVDLRAAFVCAQAAAPHMRAQGGGRIITFSDWLAKSGRPRYPGFLPYYVAKAGVIALTEALALELAADSILVNAIAPGPIVAPAGTGSEEQLAVERATPLGRWGGEIEIAKAVLALLDSDFITGETIRVDGGRHLK
jgi:NAD(P)-dependent dehydrogenase (short-subunit alcohol dehydrogenase family)